MQTKVEAAKHRHRRRHGDGDRQRPQADPLEGASQNGERCTWFLAETKPATARKKWISGRLETRGALVDRRRRPRRRSARGKSLLPAGVIRVDGDFERGDAVEIVGPDGEEIGRGLVAYDAADAERIVGRNSREIESILGYAGRAEMIHRDDMAVSGE